MLTPSTSLLSGNQHDKHAMKEDAMLTFFLIQIDLWLLEFRLEESYLVDEESSETTMR